MGLFDFLKRKKEKEAYLIQWQAVVMPENGNRLLVTEEQLLATTQYIAANNLRIMNDCNDITQSTLNPDTFFMRLNLLVEKAKHLVLLERYMSFSGASPSSAYNEIVGNYQEAIRKFLIRYFSDTFDKAEAMKTPKGRIGKYQKFYDSLQEYYCYMNDENIDYIETKYKAYTRTLRG